MTKRNTARWMGVGMLLASAWLGEARAANASDTNAWCTKESDVARSIRKRNAMIVCVDMVGSPRVVSQSKAVLLANRPVIVVVHTEIGKQVEVSLSGTAGMVDQGIAEAKRQSQVRSRQGGGGHKAEPPPPVPPSTTSANSYYFPPRQLADGESNVTLTVRSWTEGTGAAAWEGPAHAWVQMLNSVFIPNAEATIEIDDARVDALRQIVSELEVKLGKETDTTKQDDLSKKLDGKRAEYSAALAQRSLLKSQLAAYRALLEDMEFVASPEAMKKAQGRAFDAVNLAGPPVKPTDAEVEAAAAAAAMIRDLLETPDEMVLPTYEIPYDVGVIGSFNLGAAVVPFGTNHSYDTVETTDENTGVAAPTIVETTSGSMDVELVASYTQYFWAAPDLKSSPFVGLSVAVSFADLTGDGPPGSIYLGPSGGFKNLSVGLYIGARKVTQLQPGYEIGDTLDAGEEVPTSAGYRLAGAVMVSLTPDLFTVKR